LEKDRLRAQEQERLGSASQGDKQKATPPSAPVVPPTIPTGIIEHPTPPFPSSVATINNSWQEIADGRLVQFYAGAFGDDPEQGVVILNKLVIPGSDAAPEPVQWFPTPTKVGAVRIVGVDGTKLSLLSVTDQQLTFDTASLRYL
jgi:hypothetical protein